MSSLQTQPSAPRVDLTRLSWRVQRWSAKLMVGFVVIHLLLMMFAVQGGLTAGEILSRTRGNWGWLAFYLGFVGLAGLHAPVGVRNILCEQLGLSRPLSPTLAVAHGAAIYLLGLRACLAVFHGGAF